MTQAKRHRFTRIGDALDIASQWAVTAYAVALLAALAAVALFLAAFELAHLAQYLRTR